MNNLREQIISLVESHEEGLKPCIIAKILSKKQSTIKSMMSRMAKEHQLVQNYGGIRGAYSLNPALQKKPHGITNLRVQNLWCVAELDKNVDPFNEIQDIPEGSNGLWRVRKMVGKESKQLCISLSGELGFDILSCYLIIKQTLNEVNSKYSLNIKFENLEIHNVEVFADIFGVSMSKNSVNFSDLHSSLLKIYNKDNKVRVEQRTSCCLPIDFFLKTITNSSILSYTEMAGSTKEKVDEIAKKLNSINSEIHYYGKNTNAKVDRIHKKLVEEKEVN